MNEPYRLRYTNQIVGGFLLVLCVLSIAIGIAVTRVSRLLVKPNHYYVTLNEDDSTALQVGTEVIQLGKRIGQVDALEYAELNGMITVTLAIDPDHSHQITTATELSLERKFGLGNAYIKVRRTHIGNEPATPLAAGSVVRNFHGEIDRVEKMSDDFHGVADSVKKVQQEMSPSLASIDLAAKKMESSFENSFDPAFDQGKKAFESVERSSEAFRQKALDSLALLQSTTVNLDEKLSELTQNAKTSANAATTAAESVTHTSRSINDKTDKLNGEISESLKFMRDAVTSIQHLTDETRELVRVLRGEAEEIPGTTEQVRDTVQDTNHLVKEIRSHWLLRGVRQDAGPTGQISPSAVRMQAGPR